MQDCQILAQDDRSGRRETTNTQSVLTYRKQTTQKIAVTKIHKFSSISVLNTNSTTFFFFEKNIETMFLPIVFQAYIIYIACLQFMCALRVGQHNKCSL